MRGRHQALHVGIVEQILTADALEQETQLERQVAPQHRAAHIRISVKRQML